MKVLKTIRKIGNTMYKMYSKTFNTVFDILFGPFNADSMMSMYCNEDYYMTSGGVIMREE
jgi:hypothetical protein